MALVGAFSVILQLQTSRRFVSSSSCLINNHAQAVLLLLLLLPPGGDVLDAVQHDPLRLAQRQHLLAPRSDTRRRLIQGALNSEADLHI